MPDASPVEQVRAAVAAGRPPSRRAVEHALRDVFGLSARQAKRFTASGLRELGTDAAADLDEVLARVRELERSLRI